MLIYGYRNREVEKGAGTFPCPKCRDTRAYTHKKIVRYFTLFFIPLFPLGTLSEYIECQVCRRTYRPQPLSSSGLTSQALASKVLPSSGIALNSSPASTNGKACLPLGLTIAGILSLLLGCGVALILTLVQIDNPDNWQGFFGLMILCPVPAIVAGLIMPIAALVLRRKTEAAA